MRVVAACLPRLHPMAAFRAAILGALLPVVMGQAPAGGACACQDPHLNLAHGGRADFRGTHGELYNFLSSKDGAMPGLDPC